LTLPSPTAVLRALWRRDREPSLEALRVRLHFRILGVLFFIGLGLVALRLWSEGRVDLVPAAPLTALACWLWLRRFPQHHRSIVRLGTVAFLSAGLWDLGRRGQVIPWALFAMMGLPVYGTLLDGLVSGFIATATVVGLWLWSAYQPNSPNIHLLLVFNALASVCFYLTSLTYVWIFGALAQRQGLSRSAADLTSEASQALAHTLADDVTVAVGRLRAALAKRVPDRRTLKGLQELLQRARQALPQDLPSTAIKPQDLLQEQRRSAHQAYLLLALLVSVTAGVATYKLGIHNWWIAAGLSTACAALYLGGDLLPAGGPWRLRLFVLSCLLALGLDVWLSGDDAAATSLLFLPLIVFYAGMLEGVGAALVTMLAGGGLLVAEAKVKHGQMWPLYPSLLLIIGLLCLMMLGIAWAIAPSLQEQLQGLASKEDALREGLKRYRRVVSTLFHDLANPLAVLQTLASLPPALLQPEDQLRAQRMVERLESVTLAARQQAPATAAGAISLKELGRGLQDLFRERLAARRITLAFEGPAHARIRGDARTRDGLMGHLLSNAARYAPEGGTVTLQAVVHEGGLHLSLRDHGPGFPRDVLEALHRGAAPQPRPDWRGDLGNGFGLLLAQAAANDLGGTLSLGNASDGGALADLWLPA
jgi:signal transduction histidine kinase